MRVTELLARLRLDPSQFQSGLAQSQAELKRFASATNALPGGRASLFGAMAADAGTLAGSLTSLPLGIAAVGAAFTGAAVAARRAGVDFEASLARISSLGPEATAGLERTRTAILDTFATTPITGSLNELADASFLLQSSGRSATEALEDLPIAARSAVAGTTQVTVAVDGLTTVTNAWRESQLSSQTAADVLFQTVNEGKATFEELASQIGLVAPTAAGMGVRFQEVAAATAVLSVQGVRTSSIFEGLRSALLNIQSPTERFTREYADLAREFTASRVARDGLVKFLIDFDRESGGSRQALRALFSDATAFNTALGLLKNGGADAQGALNRMEESAGSLDRAFKTMNETADATERRIKNQITVAWTQLGEAISRTTLPILEQVARVINNITDNAAFAESDVRKLLSTSGQLGGFPQASALTSVVRQYQDNPQQFLASLTPDEIRQLPAMLQRLRAAGAYRNSPWAPSEQMITELQAEAARQQARREAQIGSEAKAAQDASAAAEKLAKDEELARRREAARVAAEKAQTEAQGRARAAAAERDRAIRETEAAIERLTAESTQALGGVQATLIRQLQQMVAESEKMLRSGYLSEEAKQRLQAQVELAKELQSDMINATGQQAETARVIAAATRQSQADALFNIEARQRELRAALAVTRNVQARALIEKQISELVEARERQTITIEAPKIDVANQKLREQVQILGDLAQSIATAGDQLGVLPQRAVAALRGIGALAESGSRVFGQWSQLTALGKLAGGAGLAAGVASLAASLLGDSPEERARKQAMRENTDAIRTLSREIGDLSASSVSGSDQARIAAALGEVISNPSRVTRQTLAAMSGDPAGFIAGRSGISRRTIEELAADLGIELTSVGALLQLNEALQLRDLNAYAGTFAGTMQALEDTLRADGITDAVEVLRRRIETLTRPETGFPALAAALEGLDVADVEQRATALARTRALFEQVRTGQLPIADLGGLSIPDARNTLLDLIQSLRDTTSGGPAGTGGYQEVRTVSEVTASRLVGLTATSASYLRQIAADITALRERFTLPALPSIMPPALGALGLQAQAVMVTVQQLVVQVTLPAGTTAAEAGAIGQQLGRGIGATLGPSLVESIDVAMGRRQQLQRLFTGDLEVLPS